MGGGEAQSGWVTCPRSHREKGRGQQPTAPRLTHLPRAELPAHLQPATRDHRRGAARVPGLLRQPGLRQRDFPTAAPQEQPPKPVWRAQPPSGQVRPSPPPPPEQPQSGIPSLLLWSHLWGRGQKPRGVPPIIPPGAPPFPGLAFPATLPVAQFPRGHLLNVQGGTGGHGGWRWRPRAPAEEPTQRLSPWSETTLSV